MYNEKNGPKGNAKMRKRRVLGILLAMSVLPCVLAGCSSGKSVMVAANESGLPEGYGKYVLTEEMYRYWMISWKDYYVKNYSDVEDTPEYWDAMATGELTNEEYLTENIRTRILYYYAAQPLFDELGLKKSAYADQVDEYMDGMLAQYDSKAECNRALDEKYGITLADLEQVYTFEARYQAVYDYLYGSKGVDSATPGELDAYYQANYARVKYVLMLKNQRYRVNEDGTRVTDSNGRYILDDLTDGEKAKVKSAAETVRNELISGVTHEGYDDPMDYYVKTYMEEFFPDVLTAYPNGFYITPDEYTLHSATLTEAAMDMEIGEISLVENEDCYFIVKKYGLIDRAYESDADVAQFANLTSYCNSEKFVKYFSGLVEGVSFAQEVLDKYRLSEI